MRPLTVIVTSLAGASAVALGGYWLGHAGASKALSPVSPGESTNVNAPAEGDDRVDEAIGKLERRLGALEFKQLIAKAAEPQAPAPPPSAGPAPPPDIAAMKRRDSERLAAIEAALKREPRDNAWAPPTEGQMQTAVEAAVKEGAQFSVKSLKCLTSICEMVLSASSPDYLRHTDLELAPRLGGWGSIDIALPETAADGSATLTFRMYRQGYPRPDEGT